MTKVSRIDVSGRLGKIERTPAGAYRIPAYVTRVGVLEYMREDGSIQREYRPSDEVSAPASLESLADCAITDFHPYSAINPMNHREFAVGHITGAPAPAMDGDFVAATMVVADAREIALIDAGERVENSCGYDCVLDMTPGVAPDGTAYDAIQRAITYNHVALLPKGFGRAGTDVALRLDSKGAPVIRLDSAGNSIPPGAETSNMTVKTTKRTDEDTSAAEESATSTDAEVCATCGAPVDAEGKYVAPAPVEDAKAEDRADAKDLRRLNSELQSKLDTANEMIASLKSGRVDAKDMQRIVRERASLERTAAKVGLEESKFDSLDDAALKRAVIGKVFPKRKLDGRDEHYVEATYDSAREVISNGEYRPTVAADVKPKTDANQTIGGDPLADVKEQLRKDGAL